MLPILLTYQTPVQWPTAFNRGDGVSSTNQDVTFQCCGTNAQLIKVYPDGDLAQCSTCGRQALVRNLRAAIEKIAAEVIKKNIQLALRGRKPRSQVIRRTVYGFLVKLEL